MMIIIIFSIMKEFSADFRDLGSSVQLFIESPLCDRWWVSYRKNGWV